MIPKLNPRDASDVLKSGGTAIYPTEGIYGLGCDPFNSKSVENIFRPEDPTFGIRSNPEMLLVSGLQHQTVTTLQMGLFDIMFWIMWIG